MNIRDIKKILELTEGENILRRYFVLNGFDGALTALGVILGSLIARGDPSAVLFGGVGAAIALGVSGFWIAYLTERAERIRDIKDLEKDMIITLENTRFAKANVSTALIVSLVNGLSPFTFAILSILPFIFVLSNVITMAVGYMFSIGIIIGEVIILGMLLGQISEQNKLLYALKILPALIVIAILLFLLELFT